MNEESLNEGPRKIFPIRRKFTSMGCPKLPIAPRLPEIGLFLRDTALWFENTSPELTVKQVLEFCAEDIEAMEEK